MTIVYKFLKTQNVKDLPEIKKVTGWEYNEIATGIYGLSIEDLKGHIPATHLVVALDGRKVVGYAAAIAGAWMFNVWVDKAYRRQGIASHMYDLMEQKTRKKLQRSSNMSEDAEEFWKKRESKSFVTKVASQGEFKMGFLKKIELRADIMISFRQTIDKIKNFKQLPNNVQDAIKSADHIESKGFQELLGYDKENKIMWSAGGHWDGHGNKPTEKFAVENFGGMKCPHCKNITLQWSE